MNLSACEKITLVEECAHHALTSNPELTGGKYNAKRLNPTAVLGSYPFLHYIILLQKPDKIISLFHFIVKVIT